MHMAPNPIPARQDVPEEYTWNLGDLFPSDEAWLREYEAMKDLGAELAAFRGTLGRSGEDLLAWYRKNDAVSLRAEALFGYAACRADQDTGDAQGQ